MTYTIQVSDGGGDWSPRQTIVDFDRAKIEARTYLMMYEMVRLIDGENHIVYFEWIRK